MNEKQGQLYETMINYFKEDDWKFQTYEGEGFIRMGFSGESGSWECIADAKEDRNVFIFYSIVSVKIPENRRVAVGEYLNRANYGLLSGNFEIDHNDGEVRYKTCIDVTGDRLSEALIRRLVYTNVFMMDRYLPGIMAVAYGNKSPKEAIEDIEGLKDSVRTAIEHLLS